MTDRLRDHTTDNQENWFIYVLLPLDVPAMDHLSSSRHANNDCDWWAITFWNLLDMLFKKSNTGRSTRQARHLPGNKIAESNLKNETCYWKQDESGLLL